MASAGEPRRVLIIVQNLPVPFDRRVWLEATTLRQSGYTVSVICPKAKGFTRSYEDLEGVHIFRYPLPIEARGRIGYIGEFAWCFIRTLGKSLRVAIHGPGFDVIQACNPPDTYWVLGRLWKVFGKRFVFDHHDLSPEMFEVKFGRRGFLRSVLLFLERMTFRTANVSIATNESHRRIAIERGRMDPARVFVVRSGPDLERLAVYPPDDAWRRGVKHVLVYLGEMCEQDGVDYLVRAIQHIRDDFQQRDIHCIFVGGGPHQDQLKDYAVERRVIDLCTFTGRVSDEVLCRILSSADIAIDPDPKTPWSDQSTMNKIMEYMFFGLPIVCFDLTENRFSAQEAALYAEANDARSMARSILELLDNPERRVRMGRFGQERVQNELAWHYSVPNLLTAYEVALSDHPFVSKRHILSASSLGRRREHFCDQQREASQIDT